MVAFDNLGDFSDSRTKLEECEINFKQQSYDEAMEFMSAESYMKAYKIFVSLGDFGDSNEKIEYLMNNTYLPLVLADIGSVVTFGSYEQDNDVANGREPIEWIVIKKKDGKALLISRYVLDSYYYNERMRPVSWAGCSARSWLNDIFFNQAFTSEEKQRILDTDVTYFYGSTTTDKVFFLSKDEVFEYFEEQSDRATIATEYAIQQNNYLDERPLWMLRTQKDAFKL